MCPVCIICWMTEYPRECRFPFLDCYKLIYYWELPIFCFSSLLKIAYSTIHVWVYTCMSFLKRVVRVPQPKDIKQLTPLPPPNSLRSQTASQPLTPGKHQELLILRYLGFFFYFLSSFVYISTILLLSSTLTYFSKEMKLDLDNCLTHLYSTWNCLSK